MNTKRTALLSLMLCSLLNVTAGVPRGYYATTRGLCGAELKEAMHAIISEAHVLSYGSGAGSTWSGFYQTDRMDDGQVRDRYSYEIFYFAASASAVNASAVSGMNIEHSFPKSWWGGTQNQAYRDLYNLMPCEATINSAKSNYAMGRVESVNQSNGCTKVGRGNTTDTRWANLWEPADEWKGDFARNYFYMVTAYSDLTWTSNGLDMLENSEWPTLQAWASDLLLQWSREDPVDEIETARNEAVYRIQGNRNPFIDFPQLAEYVWGDSITRGFPGVIGEEDDTETDVELLRESFLAGLGEFTSVHADGTASDMWTSNSSYGAVANAYSKGKTADDWLLSPPVELTGMKDIRLSFDHAAGYHGSADVREMFEVLVSTDYDGIPERASWQPLDVDYPGSPVSGNFTSYLSVKDFDLSDYADETIRLAFRYRATSAKCWAWELKYLTLMATRDVTGILSSPLADAVQEEPLYYTLDGACLGHGQPRRRGMYIQRQGDRAVKIYVR